MIETVFLPGNGWKPKVWYWWIMSGDSWQAPEFNNGYPYLPGIKNQTLRNFYWYCRNPFGNMAGYVVGVSDKDRWITGTVPVMATTPADEVPIRRGWKWAVTKCGWLRLPFVGYYGIVEFYIGWRPSGAFGIKLVNASQGEN